MIVPKWGDRHYEVSALCRPLLTLITLLLLAIPAAFAQSIGGGGISGNNGANVTWGGLGGMAAGQQPLPTAGVPGAFSPLEQTQLSTLPVTTTTLTCLNPTGTYPDIHYYSGTLSGNVTYPLSATNCVDRAQIIVTAVQDAAHTVGFSTTAAGGFEGTACSTLGTTAGNQQTWIFQYNAARTSWVRSCGVPVPAVSLGLAAGGTACQVPPGTYASRDPSPVVGETCWFTDGTCTAQTAVAGSGAGCAGTWNGTVWMPAGNAASAASGGVQVANDIGGTNAAPTIISTHLSVPGPIAQGFTNASTAAGARTNFGLTATAIEPLPTAGTPGNFAPLMQTKVDPLPGTSTLACLSGSNGVYPDTHWYSGTLAGSVTFTLPASGCVDAATIGVKAVQNATNTVTFVAAGGATIVGPTCPALGLVAGNTETWEFQWNAQQSQWLTECQNGAPVTSAVIGAGGGLLTANNLNEFAGNPNPVLANLGIGSAGTSSLPTIGAPGNFSSLEQTINHTLPTTSATVSCTSNATGNYPAWDRYAGTLSGVSPTWTLPDGVTAGQTCVDGSGIAFLVIQDSTHAITDANFVTSAAGGIKGTACPNLGLAAGNQEERYYTFTAGATPYWTVNCGQFVPTVASSTNLTTLTTSPYVPLSYDQNIDCSSSTIDITVNLPVAGQTQKRDYLIKNKSTNGHVCIIHPDQTAPDTIDGSSTDIVINNTNGLLHIREGAAGAHAWDRISNSWGNLTSAGQPLQDAPVWMHYLGTGAEADPCVGNVGPCTTAAQTIVGTHYYANFTVEASGTLSVTDQPQTGGASADMPEDALVVVSPGTCTIAGTINAAAIIQGPAIGDGGSAGGGGGGSSALAGTAGSAGLWPGGTAVQQLSGFGSLGALGANNGGNCPAGLTTATKNFVAANLANMPGRLGGGPGGGANGCTKGAAGGAVILICNNINLTGTINVSGGAGASGSAGNGACGGGGGGFFLRAAHTYVADTPTITITKGAGGTGATGSAGQGGNGCDGWSAKYTLN